MTPNQSILTSSRQHHMAHYYMELLLTNLQGMDFHRMPADGILVVSSDDHGHKIENIPPNPSTELDDHSQGTVHHYMVPLLQQRPVDNYRLH